MPFPPRPVPQQPQQLPPRPAVLRPSGRLLRMFTHALCFLIVAHLAGALALRTTPPGYAAVMRLLAPGDYAPLAVAWSAALHRQQSIIIALVILIMVGIWPCTMNDLAAWLTPVGAGVLLGSLVERVVRESHGEQA